MVQDIIVVLNWNDSYELRKPVVELYRCTNKLIKDKSFSGPLYPFNFQKDKRPNNLQPMAFENLKSKLGKSVLIADSVNKYIVDEDDLIAIILNLYASNIIYYKKDKRAKLYLINSISDQKHPYDLQVNYRAISENNNVRINIVLSRENNLISPKKSSAFFSFNKYNFVIIENKFYFIKTWADTQLLNFATENKSFIPLKRFKSSLKGIEITGDAIKFNKDTQNYSIVSGITPAPSFYLQYKKEKWYGTLLLRYGEDGPEVDYNILEEFIVDNSNKTRVKRNIELEASFADVLRNFGWKETHQGFWLDRNDISKAVQPLIAKGWRIFSEKDKKTVHNISNLNIKVSSTMDWFELEIKDQHGANFLTFLRALRKEKPWIELKDGNNILMPTFMLENREMFLQSEENDGALKVPKRFIGFLSNILKESGSSQDLIPDFLKSCSDINFDLSTSFTAELWDYQVTGVKWLSCLQRNHFGACLADDMGLGKTIQVIALLSESSATETGVSLVVVPKTLLFNWKKEISKFNSNLRYEVYHGDNKDSVLKNISQNDVDIILTTYATLRNDIKNFEEFQFRYLILDEAQLIKNFNSKTYKEINKIQSKNRLVLTGTPIENNINELWGLINFINPGLLGTQKNFERSYGDLNKDNLRKLNNAISPFILRRTKTQVLNDLPDKVEQEIYCEMEEDQRELYDLIKCKIREDLFGNNPMQIHTGSKVLEGLLYLRQICCHPKLLRSEYNILDSQHSGKFETLKKLLTGIIRSGNKILVFSQFTMMLKIIEQWIVNQGWTHFYLDGDTVDREKVISNFENFTGASIFLLSLKAGGLGLNLVSASYVVIYDPWWNPAVENQAIDRAYRIGQCKNVMVYKLITLSSIEEKIMDLKRSKSEIAECLLEDQDVIKDITLEDLKKLLRD